MARLQDFQTVTPTSSDNILIVQSGGQGLASVGSTLGAKMDKTNPSGTGALSINRKSGTTTGENSVAVGTQVEASGVTAVATGNTTTASGNMANANGYGTVANHRSQFVFGEWNTADTSTAEASSRGNYVEIVGKGTSGANRSNARTLDWSGNEVLAGDLTINGNVSVGNALAFSSGEITWNDTNVTGDTTRKLWQKLGRLVVACIEFTPKASKIAHQTVIATGFPLPLNSNYSVFDNGGQQVRVGTNGDLSYYFPTDTTTIRRHDLTIVYFTA